MKEPDGAIEVEGWSTADSSEVHGNGAATTDQDRDGGTWEPGGAGGTAVPGVAVGARCN